MNSKEKKNCQQSKYEFLKKPIKGVSCMQSINLMFFYTLKINVDHLKIKNKT
jgi:hypothetical protein